MLPIVCVEIRKPNTVVLDAEHLDVVQNDVAYGFARVFRFSTGFLLSTGFLISAPFFVLFRRLSLGLYSPAWQP
jgi:hypothetical protein